MSGEKLKLYGKEANALRDYLDVEKLDLDDYDDGAIEHHGH